MAERRMFSKSVIDDDKFIDMKISAQYLYFHLAMRADDDGFVNGTKRIIRMIKCKEKDLDELIENGFVIAFESGVIAIRHWRLHNSIQKDRYKPTVYQEEKDTLSLEGGVYNPADNMDTECIQSVSLSETQVSIGKVSNKGNKEDKEREGMFSEENTHASETPTVDPPLTGAAERVYRAAMKGGMSHDEVMALIVRKKDTKDGDGA